MHLKSNSAMVQFQLSKMKLYSRRLAHVSVFNLHPASFFTSARWAGLLHNSTVRDNKRASFGVSE